ncbi:hypothetical protein Bhyg_05221 [Pseudolycoriella hygida]|uniref:Uncharacterized protein n=2 Tax=Pseudolycoriella hygida TaxID=35572 RepID=A0A9Q0MIL1_9DIPT|nr:hypothetical protein Bhyg_16918 [Pseudolycoriella hygida]KAJ6649978.1 hypothetical protein Bhyg_05221 [Pseudolycoriella hygida]
MKFIVILSLALVLVLCWSDTTSGCSLPECCQSLTPPWAVDRCRNLWPTRSVCRAWFEAGCNQVRCECWNPAGTSCTSENCRS